LAANGGRPGRGVGRSMSLDEATVLVEDRLGRYEERFSPISWDEPGEQRDHCTIGPGELRTRNLADEHQELVAQDEDLGVLGERAHSVGPHHFVRTAGEAVQEPRGHGRQPPRTGPCTSRCLRE